MISNKKIERIKQIKKILQYGNSHYVNIPMNVMTDLGLKRGDYVQFIISKYDENELEDGER
nr:MAG: SpoVT-AbrB domain superfamily protein [Lokiarchaeota virus Skoll Meg22_1214]